MLQVMVYYVQSWVESMYLGVCCWHLRETNYSKNYRLIQFGRFAAMMGAMDESILGIVMVTKDPALSKGQCWPEPHNLEHQACLSPAQLVLQILQLLIALVCLVDTLVK